MKRRLAELKERFDQDVPNRISLIEAAMRRVERDDNVPLALSEMRGAAHRLAGSAATFGYGELSTVAHLIEEEVDRLTITGRVPTSEEMERLRELVGQLGGNNVDLIEEEGVEEEVEEGELGEEVLDHDPSRFSDETTLLSYVVAVGEDRGVPTGLREQISVFGIEVHTVEDLDAVVESEDNPGVGFLLLSLPYLRSRLEQVTDLIERKRERKDLQLRLFVFAEEDEFEGRLESVRAGADAFFLLPVDVSDVVDRIERIAGEFSQEPLHVLIVDDDPEQVSNTALTLQSGGMITSVATDPTQVIPIMIENKPELVILDMYLPGCTGAEVARLIRQEDAFVGIPIIFLSQEQERAKQLRAIESGGDDFLTKPVDPHRLAHLVRTRAGRTRSMRRLMERDSLTGLLNHSYLLEVLEREMQRAARIDGALSFAMIDIDHFKSVNDTYGHLVGDHVLRSLSRLLSERLRKTDTVGRYGGEEFGVVLFNTNPEDARRILDELRESFERISFHAAGEEFSVTFSCGLAQFPERSEPNSLVEAADHALYVAKENGRNQVVLA
ncbi:MAG: diguanylate cyclase [Spirochaetaceae bacterium]